MGLIEERKNIILELMGDRHYVPMKIKELAIVLNVPRDKRAELEHVLNVLLSEGKISLSKRGKYSIAKEEILKGVFQGNEKGYGFVTVEGADEDYFIPEQYVNGAFNQDTVQIAVQPEKTGRRREAKIVKIISHSITEIVGLYRKNKGFGFVIPDDNKIARDIYVNEDNSKGAVTGHKVVVKITDYGNSGKKPEGAVAEILGHVNNPGVDILSIIKSFNIPTEYPEEVMIQTEQIENEVSEDEKAGRMDLRGWQTVTIDGEDAKDLDDAITISKKDGKYILGVHIADVTNYVTEGSPLDKEALKRGTSVYLVDRVIPMLPHKLSNGICSLNAGCDRLALSCIMEINADGNITDHTIAETVINVDRRMTYTAVKKILEDNDREIIEEYKELVFMFELMWELSCILREKREQRGSIDFDFPESKIVLDERGRVVDIKPYERNVATKIIEDFMLLANETVAEDFYWQELPFIYRTHDKPDPEKMIKLGMFINNFGFAFKFSNGEVHPKEVQKLLTKIEGKPEEPLISRLALRSMKQAKYTTVNTGHFGLSAKYYCHFTSPIRRYPDLQIHRIIKENIKGRLNDKRIEHFDKIIPLVAESCSINERRADEAERDTEKIKKIEYMKKHIGEEFEGVISGITAWGIYVELPNTVEGMIHVTNMDGDYFSYDGEHYEMVGETTGKRYKLGQTVKIVVLSADKLQRTIDFKLAVTF